MWQKAKGNQILELVKKIYHCGVGGGNTETMMEESRIFGKGSGTGVLYA